MVDYRAKFDSELHDIHTSFLDLRSGNRDRVYPIHSEALHGGPVSLLLRFGSDLAGIEARGFRTEWVEGNFARGDVELADMEAVASHSEVIQLEYGATFRPLLDTSVKEINASKVWTLKPNGEFDGDAGAGVIIGVIDTGIDIRHPVFLKPGTKDTTRIKRIWDMGIDAHDGLTGPDTSLLRSGFTYGVEYKEKMINDVLQKGSRLVKHKDCHGHGTHAASIAAGDGRAPRGRDKYRFVGVAPEADLIVVKMFFLKKDPVHNGAPLSHERMIEDAVTYVDRVAKTEELKDRPVVINLSLGAEYGPHDGLSASEGFIETLFRNASKRALVAAAGNEADARQHALITVPANGEIEVPFALYDERTKKHAALHPKDEASCESRDNARPELKIEFWYRLGPQQALTSDLTLPGGTSKTGPPLGSKVDGNYKRGFLFYISHEAVTTQRPPSPAPLTRNVLRIKVTPKTNKLGETSFGTGPFTLRLKAPANTKIHVWGEPGWPPHGFRMGHDKPNTKPTQMLPLPAATALAMDISDESTLNSPGTSAGAITVGAYIDTDPGKGIWDSSSQGPLVDYSGSGPYVAKPDLAAPGVEIEAATGEKSLLRRLATELKLGSAPYGRFTGTSAAAPHVAGVAALMFERKPSLSRAELVQKLKDHARTTPQQQDPNTFGAGRVDAEASHGAV